MQEIGKLIFLFFEVEERGELTIFGNAIMTSIKIEANT